jgi:hypothetical protein
MGSPSYIAPETWRGDSALLDGRADLFALAVIVFRWLTGKLPFEASDLIGKMTAVTGGPRPSALALRPELPPAVDVWMSRALAVEPADRFQTGADFYDALGAALRGEMWAASADVSGVRQVAKVTPGTETPERKNALATAWRAAASLLRRFTGSRDRETPEVTPPPAPAPKPLSEPREEPSATDRKTLWLDSEHLEEVPESEHQPAPEPAKAVTPPPAKPKRQPQPKPQPKAKKPKANAKPKNAKRPKKIKPTQKRKPSSRKRNA